MLRGLFFVAVVAVSGATARTAFAQSSTTDPRLYPYLGCWRSDSAAARSGSLTCVVPVANSADVDMVGIVDGRVASHHRITADNRAHTIDGQGCRGQERTSWSPLSRRVYLRSEYVCATTGITGGSTTLFSFLPSGEWLEVEHVRSGSGSLVRTERHADAGIPSNLPREIAGQIGAQRLAVVTARAEAASPLRSDDVIETVRSTDSDVARAWLAATAQHFSLSSDEFAALTRASVPAPVLQAMMSTPPAYQLGVGTDAQGRSTDVYLNSPGWAPASVLYSAMYPAYAYPPVIYEPVYIVPQPIYQSVTYYTPPPVYNYVRPYTPVYYRSPDYSPYYRPGFSYSYNTPSYTSYRGYRAPSYSVNPVGVRGASVVHNVPASPPPAGRKR